MYILREFGGSYYKNVLYVNLETNTSVPSYFDGDISPERLIRYLEAYAGEAIIPESTLIIFDEIQSCERALTALKYYTAICSVMYLKEYAEIMEWHFFKAVFYGPFSALEI